LKIFIQALKNKDSTILLFSKTTCEAISILHKMARDEIVKWNQAQNRHSHEDKGENNLHNISFVGSRYYLVFNVNLTQLQDGSVGGGQVEHPVELFTLFVL
jgi:hypothetical protein